MAPTCGGPGSRARGARDVRGNHRMPPHLPAVALETPLTLARRGSGRRPSGGRCGGCSRRSGRRSRAAAATTGVPVNASRSDGKEFQKRERSCKELSGPGAARKRGPGGWWRQIAYTAEECTGCCRRRHRSLRGHQPPEFRRGAGRQAASQEKYDCAVAVVRPQGTASAQPDLLDGGGGPYYDRRRRQYGSMLLPGFRWPPARFVGKNRTGR